MLAQAIRHAGLAHRRRDGTTPGETMAVDNTKDRIVHATSELFREQGYNATSVKQIVNQAEAQLGSVYHYFPLGKQELGAEAIRVSGALYEQLIPAVFDAAPDVVTGVRDFFDGAGEHLVQTDYADACPIATVALEVSSTLAADADRVRRGVRALDRRRRGPVLRRGRHRGDGARADDRDAVRA